MSNNSVSWMAANWWVCLMAHCFGAYSIVLTTAFLFPHAVVAVVIATVVAAALKEFVYDLIWELPKQTLWDSTLDFLGYLLGMALAIVAIRLGSLL